MKSSRDHNRPELFLKRLKLRSVSWGLIAGVIGILIAGLIGLKDGNIVTAVLTLLVIFGAAWSAYRFSEHLYGGEFLGHNKELLEAKIEKFQGRAQGGFSFENLMCSMFVHPKNAKELNTPLKFDPDSQYRIQSNSAEETFGFDLLSYQSEPDAEPGLYPSGYRTLYQRLLRNVPSGSIVQFPMRFFDTKVEFIEKHRPALVQKNVKDVHYYVLIGLKSTIHNNSHKQKILNLMRGFRRLTREEISAYNEGVATPNLLPSGLKLPFYAATGVSDGDFVQTSVADNITGATALGRLPKDPDEFFGDYLEPLRHVNGTIVTRFFMQEEAGLGELLKTMRQQNKNKDNTATKGELDAEASLEEAEREGDLMRAHMDIIALVHGDKNKVDEALSKTQSPKLRKELQDSDRAKFVQILGHIKPAHSAVMAGSYSMLRERLQKITRFAEAALYIGTPLSRGGKAETATLAFRNEDQSIEWINLAHSDKSLFNAVVGPPGSGKSALISAFIRGHELRHPLYGIKTATILIDVGSSQRWRTESLGTADIIFDLAKDERGNWKPLPIHPFEALMFEGGLSDNDFRHARGYICQLLMLDAEEPSQSTSVEVVGDSVRELVRLGRPYSMTRFHEILERVSKKKAQGFSGQSREAFEALWQNNCSFIKRFTRHGEFGRVFDPVDVQKTDLQGISFFYANVESQEKDPKDLNGAFLMLAHNLAYAIADRYGPYSKVVAEADKRSIIWINDEHNWQKEFVNETKTTDQADQCRKFGIQLFLIVQNLEYLLRKGVSGDEALTMIKSIAKFFIYDEGGESNRRILTAIGTNEEKGREISRNVERGRQRYEEFGEFSFVYVDEHRRVRRLLNDLESDFLWEITTHAGGQNLRNYIASELNITRHEAAVLLDKYGPLKVPKAALGLPKMEAVRDAIKREERFYG